MFSSKEGLKKEWEASGYPCISNAATSDGSTALIQTKLAELCVIDTATGTSRKCYRAEGDIVGPVYARHNGGSTFIYSTATDSYSFEASTGLSTPFNLNGKAAGAYMTAYGSTLYIPLPSCAGVPGGVTCVTQANAEGGVLIGVTSSGIKSFVRTASTIYSSSGSSYTLNGDFKEWQFDKDVLGVRTSNAYTILYVKDLSVQNTFTGTWLYGSMASIQFNSGRERTVALESASTFEIHDVKATGSKKVAKSAVADPGPILPLLKPEYAVLTGSQRALMVFTTKFATNVNGGLDVSFKDTSVPFPSTATVNPSTCTPLVLSSGALGSEKVLLQTYSGSIVRTFSKCDTTAGDADCVKPESVTVNTADGGVIIAIAIALSFALVPSSIYAYRERKYCLAKQSEVPATQVYFDREKGISYDPAYEAYVNQFAEAKRRKGKSNDEDDEE